MDKGGESRRHCLAAWFIIGAWVICALFISMGNPTIGISDMFGFINDAEELSLSKPSHWVDGLYPFGYPLMLKSLTSLTGDYLVSGRILSIFFGSLGLYILYRLASEVLDAGSALLALLLCCTNPLYIKFSVVSGTDMPAAVMMLAGACLLCFSCVERKSRYFFYAGAATGAAYLIRYTVLAVIPAVIIWVLFGSKSDYQWKRKILLCLGFLTSFVLAASPQMILSMIVKGDPLYNTQTSNIMFGMFGDGNWGLNMPGLKSSAGLFEIIARHPVLYIRNWFGNCLHAFQLELIEFPLNIIAYFSLFFSLRSMRHKECNLLCVFMVLSFIAVLSTAFVHTRLLLFCGIMLAIYAAYAIRGALGFVPERVRVPRFPAIPLRRVLLALIVLWPAAFYLCPAIADPLSEYDRNRIRVSTTLSEAGVKDPSKVLSFSFDYYDMGKTTKDRFSIPWYKSDFRPYRSVSDIADRMAQRDQEYLVYDHRATRNVKGLKKFWPPAHEEMEKHFLEIARFSDSVYVYRLMHKEYKVFVGREKRRVLPTPERP